MNETSKMNETKVKTKVKQIQIVKSTKALICRILEQEISAVSSKHKKVYLKTKMIH